MSLNEETEQNLKNLLKIVHNQVDWNHFGQRSYKWDVYAHAIRAASNQESLPKFLDRLCDNLGIQSLQAPTELLQRLRVNQRVVLEALRKETMYWVALVIDEVQK
jgi:hypothetical protein